MKCNNLELHAAHACNLFCESCSHYSNQKHKGILSLETAEEWFKAWAPRIQPRQFAILGGEPTLNPNLSQLVWLVHSYWRSNIVLVTNGFFLDRHPHLPVALFGTGAALCISVHHFGAEYLQKLKPVEELVEDWQRRWRITVRWRESFDKWVRVNQGLGKQMRPFNDGDPQASWAACRSKWCLQLHDGKLWKCPAVAYLGLQHAKYGLGQEWESYLAYEPLTADCSDQELEEFLGRRAEDICNMCPAAPENFQLPSPLSP